MIIFVQFYNFIFINKMITIFIVVSPNNFNIVFPIVNAIATRNHVRRIAAPQIQYTDSLITLKFDDNNLRYAENAYSEIQRNRYITSISLIVNNEEQTFENPNVIEYDGEEKENEESGQPFNMNNTNDGFFAIYNK
jgi:hypothetical protein